MGSLACMQTLPKQIRSSLETQYRAKRLAERMVLPTCFDFVEESFSEEVQFKKLSPPVKTSRSSTENVYLVKPLTNALFFTIYITLFL